MNSCNQKMLVVILSLALAFSFTADCAQIQSQAAQASSSAYDQDPTDMMLAKQRATSDGDKEEKEEKENQKDEDDEKDAQDSHSSDENDLSKVKHELTENLHKQSELTHRIEDLSNEAESDEEIDEAAKQVAKDTESAAMGDMLGHMWKDMRMLELPAYAKHVKEELHHLKHEESELEAKLTADQGKISAAHDEDKKQEKHKEKEETEDDEEEKEEVEGGSRKSVKNGKLRANTKAPTSTWNFWQMSRAQQKSVFLSSLVYVIGGLLAAVLFKQVREKLFVLKLMPESAPDPSAKDFSFHICGCLADWKLCVLGFCCPCLAWANTLDRRKGLLSYWPAFIAFFGLLVLNVYTVGIAYLLLVALGVYYRQKIREIDDIDSCYSGKKATLGMDILLWCFCQPCAIIQEAREEGVNRTRVTHEAV